MPAQDRNLQDRRALVTGGTKGIGHAVAARLRESGATVLLTARTAPSGMPDTDFVAADVATPDGCATVVDAVSHRLGGADIVVHVVGGSSAPAGGFAVLDDREGSQSTGDSRRQRLWKTAAAEAQPLRVQIVSAR